MSPPAQRIERPLSGPRIAADGDNVLVWRNVVADRQVELRRDRNFELARDLFLCCRSPVTSAHLLANCSNPLA